VIHGERVKQVRELLGLTQEQFGEQIGATQAIVAHIEAGRVRADEFAQRLVFKTGFPPAFFERPPGPGFPLGSLMFRAHGASLDSKTLGKLHREAELANELLQAMMPRVTPIPVRVPRLHETTPAEAARVTRAAIGLAPDGPVPNLTHELEKAGVVILPVHVESDHFDGFSLWAGDHEPRVPVMVINAERPPDRWRWNVCHELGHLVLHHALRGGLAEIERQADQFAAEFLMPADSVRSELPTPLTLPVLADLKRRWRVSMQAIIRRARDLGAITEAQYYYWLRRLASKGWRKSEPAELVMSEKPRLLRKIAEVLYQVPVDAERLAADYRLPTRFVKRLLDAYAEQPSREKNSKLVSGRLTLVREV